MLIWVSLMRQEVSAVTVSRLCSSAQQEGPSTTGLMTDYHAVTVDHLRVSAADIPLD